MTWRRTLGLALAACLGIFAPAPLRADNTPDTDEALRQRIERRLDEGTERMRQSALETARAALAASGRPAPDVAAALAAVTPDEALSYVKFLASDELKGRETGEEGCRLAAEYIAERFRAAGLTPVGDDGTFFQHYTIRARKGRKDTANVVGALVGSDPALKDEVVVVGAHYDHLGQGRGWTGGRIGGPKGDDDIWNGADDNASGTSGVLAIAHALGTARLRPRRTVLFALFSGEEKGLLGSAHYVKAPIYPLKQTVAMINCDMISRNSAERIGVMGTATSPVWKAWVEAAAREAGIDASIYEGFTYAQSDQFSFYQKGIPALFFEDGMHKDYHRVTDSWDKINPGKVARTARLAGRVVWEAANTAEPIPFTKFSSRLFGGASAGKPRLGVELDELDEDARTEAGLPEGRAGVLIKSVLEDTAAAKAGMQDGDIVLAFGGKRLPQEGAAEAFRAAIRTAEKGPVRITVWRDGAEVDLTATIK